MNLQPVRRYRDHVVRVCCNGCGGMVEEVLALADLDAKPGTYYCCELCAQFAELQAREQEGL